MSANVRPGVGVFHYIQDVADKLFRQRGYQFHRFVLPSGEIQFWWVSPDEEFMVSYRDKRKTP